MKSTAESINRTDDHTLDRISEVLNHIQTNYGDSIKVKDVSEMLNINYSYFCRLFKKATGRTFIEYLNYYRISIAKKRLLQDKATVTEIILDTGFSSFSYFNRIFKRYTGFSPTTYRKLFGSEQSEAS